jgi:hypothetical protein
MPDVEIPLPPELQELIEKAQCFALPKPEPAEITLPTGGRLKAIADITKGIPDSCALNFNLLVQLGPLLVNLECLVKLLNAVDKLKGVVEGLPKADFGAIPDFLKAMEELAPCIAMISGIPLFLRDIICLLIKVLGCVIDALETIVDVMDGISLELDLAGKNSERRAALECAMENAQMSAAHTMNALESLFAILKLAEPFMSISGVKPIEIPTFGDQQDIDSIKGVITTLGVVHEALTAVADALGGC